MEKKREITPHKGGRTERFYCRVNPEIKELANELAKIKNVSPADLFEEWTIKEAKRVGLTK